MSKFGLWWVMWDKSTGTHKSRMTYKGQLPVSFYEAVQWFKDRDFDVAVFLGNIRYSGRKLTEYTINSLKEYIKTYTCAEGKYQTGYSDGQNFSQWVSSKVNRTLEYYIVIPESYMLERTITGVVNGGRVEYNSIPRDCPANGFYNSYWHGWIDGVLSVPDSSRLGFYWGYESCLQATVHDPNLKYIFNPFCNYNNTEYIEKYTSFLKDMSNYIHNHGLELIWIPTIGNRTMKYVTNPNYVAVPILARYFNQVFVQPHYYQTTKLSDGSDYSFQELVRRVKWMYENGLSIEMEADNSIIGEPSNCAYCKSTQNRKGCDLTLTPETEEKCINRACDYVNAILEAYSELFHRPPLSPGTVINELFPHRAYYFGTDFEVVTRVRSKCPNW
ncbi:DUF4855 domain-containing protein [Thermococcus sp.]|uniref:DUF4855 domain-containing protein n=1 Tax=Thermococcus sp. TaxID=35749 RepID=UPI002630E581|nr:DUF4855 domain-containing protein [Thermococcus sp.]